MPKLPDRDEVIAEVPLVRDLDYHYRGEMFVRAKGSEWERTFEIVYRPYSGGEFVLLLLPAEADRLRRVFDEIGVGELD